MFDLLKTTKQAGLAGSSGGLIVSALVHATLFAAIVYERTQESATDNTWTEVVEGLTYLAPPDVNSAASKVVVRYEASGGGGGDLEANSTDGSIRARGQGDGESAAASASGGEEPEQVANPNENPYENAFSEVEVETAAERTPESAAPAYPSALMAAGIEGYAAMRFVVDSTGKIDMTSVRVLEATHAEFALAVRRAMPDMRFTPARINDKPVRQLAEQLFRFQILTPPPPPPTTPPTRRPSADSRGSANP